MFNVSSLQRVLWAACVFSWYIQIIKARPISSSEEQRAMVEEEASPTCSQRTPGTVMVRVYVLCHFPDGCSGCALSPLGNHGSLAESSRPFHRSELGLLVLQALSKPHQRPGLGCQAYTESPQEPQPGRQGLLRQTLAP